MTQQKPLEMRTWVSLLLLLVVAAFLRVHGLHRESPWNDEIFSLQCLTEPSLGAYIERYEAIDPTMEPVYFTLQYLWTRVFGTSVLAVRALSVLLGLTAMVAVFFLGRRLFNDTAGLTAAFCMSLSLIHIYYSQECRMYTLVFLFAACSMYAFVGAVETNRAWWWAAHTVADGLLVGTHLIGAFLFIPYGLFLIARRWKQPRTFALWLGLHIAALLPALALLHSRVSAAEGMLSRIHQTSLYDFVHSFLAFSGGRLSQMDPAPHLPGNISLDIVLAGYMAVLGLMLLWRDWRATTHDTAPQGRLTPRDRVTLLYLWFLAPPTGLFVLSHVWRRCFQFRYVLFSSLALYLIVGGAIAVMGSRRRSLAVFVPLALIMAYQLLALTDGPLRVDFRSASNHIEEHWQDADRVVAFKDFVGVAFTFNSDLPEDRIEMTEGFNDLVNRSIAACAESGARVWVLMYRWEHPDRFESRMTEAGLSFNRDSFGRWPGLLVFEVSRPS